MTPSLSNFCQKIISFKFFKRGLTSLPPIWTMSLNILFVFLTAPLLQVYHMRLLMKLLLVKQSLPSIFPFLNEVSTFSLYFPNTFPTLHKYFPDNFLTLSLHNLSAFQTTYLQFLFHFSSVSLT